MKLFVTKHAEESNSKKSKKSKQSIAAWKLYDVPDGLSNSYVTMPDRSWSYPFLDFPVITQHGAILHGSNKGPRHRVYRVPTAVPGRVHESRLNFDERKRHWQPKVGS